MHRDLKQSNSMIDGEERVRVRDFGSATATRGAQAFRKRTTTTTSRTGVGWGSSRGSGRQAAVSPRVNSRLARSPTWRKPAEGL